MNIASEISSIKHSGLSIEKQTILLKKLVERVKESEKKKGDEFDHTYNASQDTVNIDQIMYDPTNGIVNSEAFKNLTPQEKEKFLVEIKQIEVDLKNRDALITLEDRKLINDVKKDTNETYGAELHTIKHLLKTDKDDRSKKQCAQVALENKLEKELLKAKKPIIDIPVCDAATIARVKSQLDAVKTKRRVLKVGMKFDD